MILGPKLPIVHFVFLSDSSVHKTPIVEVVEIVSEQPRLLSFFLSRSVQVALNIKKRTQEHARMTKVQNCTSLAFFVPELFQRVAESF